jgi:peptidoglycan/LPS O-acetylase OafA/YrhL
MATAECQAANTAERELARSAKTRRFVLIDALRGLAALAVLGCHFMSQSPFDFGAIDNGIPGRIGVDIFFVLSGFVIAYSVRKERVTPGFLGNFAFRRSIRLDPPYWVAIICAIVVGAASSWMLPSTRYEPCTGGQLAAHLIYLQNVFGYKDLSPVFWTLRFEILFYLMFIITLGVSQSVESRVGANWRPQLRQALFAALGAISLAAFVVDRGPGVLRFWYMFLLGASVWWSLDCARGRKVAWILPAAMLASLVLGPKLDVLVALATAGLIFVAGRIGRLESWLGWPWLLYFGATSYSLYLVHVPVRDIVRAIGSATTGSNLLAAQAWDIVGLAASFAAADLLYRWVEIPSIEWGRRFGKRSPSSRLATGAQAVGDA